MTDLNLKEKLGERLAHYPLLRTMLFNPWFALVLLGLALIGLAAAVFLPKIWLSTPAGIHPEVKVSLVDRMQAQALRASAERKARNGDHLGALAAWQSALANNPGNLELHRGALKHVGQAPDLPIGSVNQVLYNLPWMLHLGATNRADIELMATACDKYGISEEVYLLLNPMADSLSPILEGAYLKGLFSVARYDEFGKRWEAVCDRLPKDPLLDLYRTAYLAGWGPPAGTEESLAKLEAAADDRRYNAVVCRLLMAVSQRRLDPVTFAKALERAREASRDRIADHTAYWLLLQTVGRKDEARRLATEFNRAPQQPLEVAVTAQTLRQLDLDDECLTYLRRHAREFGAVNNRWSAAIWEVYADLLMARRDWEGLEDLAVQMRSIPGGHHALAGFSRFLDGRAAYATGAIPAAEAAFREAIAAGFPQGRLGIRVGLGLQQMGYYHLALQVLLPLEDRFKRDLDYWQAVFDAAYLARDDEALLLKVAEAAHDADPRNEKWEFNYAASLLISQRRPEEALRLTWSFLARHPDSLAAQLNHALALILNGREADAAVLLDKIEDGRLNGQEAGVYHLVSAGVNRGLQNWDGLRADLQYLESERLFPAQRRWLDDIRRAMPAP